jgi:hypothetical protein
VGTDTARDFQYRSDLNRSHELAHDLLAYGAMHFPAFAGTLGNTSAYLINKLQDFSTRARRVLEREIPEREERERLLTQNPRHKSDPIRFHYEKRPVVHVLNGLIHSKDIWINHVLDPNHPTWKPTGAFVLLGFGIETDERRIDHVDLFGFAHGFLARSNKPMNDFLGKI